MDTVAPIQSALDLQAHTARPAPVAPPPPAAPAERGQPETIAAAAPAPTDVHVDFDREAGRFIQTVTDLTTDQVLRQYPSEAQLAYSRAVAAYMRALAES